MSTLLAMRGFMALTQNSLRLTGLGIILSLFPVLTVQATATNVTPPALTQNDIRQEGFIYCINDILNTFNPQMASGGLTVNTLAAQLYNRLLDVDPYTFRLMPELAERWEVLDGGARYVFHLRRDVPFQTNEWFTPTRLLNADDVLFSFERLTNPDHPYHDINGGSYPYFDSLQFANNIRSIKKKGKYTVEFTLKSPDAAFLWHIATHYAPILSAEYAQQLAFRHDEEQIDRLPVGTGPYYLSEYQAGQFIRLLSNNQYWLGQPKMPQVVIDLSSGGTGRISKLVTGECDVLAYPAASQLSIFRNDPRLRLILRPGMNIAYLAFNTRKAPFDDPKIRQAVSLAINNQRLMQSIYYGTAETAASILPRASWAFDNESKITEYAPEKAKAILRAAGLTNLQLHLWVPNVSQAYNPSPLKMAELIQADLAQVGIKVTIVPVEGRFQQTRLNDMDHELTLTGWMTDSNDPDSFFRPLLSCAAISSQSNFAHWCNDGFDKRLQQGLHSQQLSQRIEHYQAAQRILAQELPVLPLASSMHIQAYRYDIKGLIFSSFGNASFAGVYRDKSETENPPSAEKEPTQ